MTGVKNSSSIGLLAGYKFNSSFGVEVAYNSLYRNANADGLVAAMYPGTTGTYDLTSLSAAGQYTYGLSNNVSLLGNLGFHSSSYKVKSSANGSWTGSSSGLLFGLKVQYDLSKNLGIRGGFDTYTESGGITGNLTEVGMSVVTKF
jgi:OOP family OmpA-OmpF porin